MVIGQVYQVDLRGLRHLSHASHATHVCCMPPHPIPPTIVNRAGDVIVNYVHLMNEVVERERENYLFFFLSIFFFKHCGYGVLSLSSERILLVNSFVMFLSLTVILSNGGERDPPAYNTHNASHATHASHCIQAYKYHNDEPRRPSPPRLRGVTLSKRVTLPLLPCMSKTVRSPTLANVLVSPTDLAYSLCPGHAHVAF